MLIAPSVIPSPPVFKRPGPILFALALAACGSENAGGRDAGSEDTATNPSDGAAIDRDGAASSGDGASGDTAGGDGALGPSDANLQDGAPADGASPADAACTPVQAHAVQACVGDEVRWFDECGAPNDTVKRCGGKGCSAGQCVARAWFPLGNSEFGPWTSTITWGSGTGYGVGGRNSYEAWEASLALDPATGAPMIAFDDADGVSTRVRVVGWNGAAFADLGGAPLSSFGPAGTSGRVPSLAIAANHTPMVAWSEIVPGGHWNVYLRAWDGSVWSELAGSGSGTGVSDDTRDSIPPALAVDDQNQPIIVWQSASATSIQLRLRRWNGTAWVGLGGSETSGAWTSATNDAYKPAIATDHLGHPYIAFCETSTGAQVRTWNGASWMRLGTGAVGATGTAQGACYQTAIAIDRSDRPTVAWIGQGDVFLRRYTGSRWEELGGSGTGLGISQSGGSVYEASLALMSNGDPVVAWRAERPNGGINAFSVFLERWNGSAWVEIGGSASGYGFSGDRRETLAPAIAIDANDRPYAAWQVVAYYPSYNFLIHLRYWDGARWAELGASAPNPGGISDTTAGARGPRIALDSNLDPAIVWFDQTDPEGFPQILLRRFDGSSWAELGGSGTGRGISNAAKQSDFPSIVLDDAENPIVAWNEYAGSNDNSEVYLRRWSGTAWIEIAGSATGGGISGTPGSSLVPSLALDGSRAPIVSWVEQPMVDYAAYLRRFDGNAWAELDGSGHGTGISGSSGIPVLGISANGQPIVAWSDSSHVINVRRWDGAAWAAFAGGGFDPAPDEVFSFSMAVGPNDRIAIAWDSLTSTTANNAEIHLRLWDGAAWRSLAGSATGPGISANPGYSVSPVLAFDELGRPIVAWRDNSTGNAEVLLRRWDGVRWDDVLGSGTGGGVSRSANDNEGADVAYRDHRLCVTWDELGGYGQQIVLRCVEFEPN
jgi:hypothetical protein